MRRVILLATVTVILTAASALAAGIDGRFGITGKAGAMVPLKDDFVSNTTLPSPAGADPGMAAGGGIIFGVGKCLAVEIDVTHLLKSNVNISGNKYFEASLTDIALGLQYRLAADSRLVPFIGAGADFIKGELKSTVPATLDTKYNLDWTVGGHVNVGMDYFVAKGIAFTIDARGLYAADGDVNRSGTKVGSYDPLSFIGTVGIRLFLPEHPFQ
jgi:outer membrane protein